MNNAEKDKIDKSPYTADLFRCAIEHSPLPMIAMEGQSHIVRYANPAFCHLSGHKRANMLGHTFVKILPKTERNHIVTLLDRVYLSHNIEKPIEQEHTSPDGKTSYWTYLAWPMLNEEDGFAGAMLQISDTTEATQNRLLACDINKALILTDIRLQEAAEASEEKTQLLQQAMRETNHRVKNHLQILGALLDIQTMASSDEVLIGELNQIRIHIKTLASIHGLLSYDIKDSPSAGTLSIRAALDEVVTMWQQLIGVENIQWRCEDIRMSIKPCISLATIINELINNAFKHGASRVSLSVYARGDTATLEVCDNGPGFMMPFDLKTHAQIGLDLVETVCRTDIHGTTSYSNLPEGGACIRLSFPIKT